jgi:hypothetical protein
MRLQSLERAKYHTFSNRISPAVQSIVVMISKVGSMGGKMTEEKQFTFGTCEYERTSPARAELSNQTSVLNIIIPFEQALKLNLAVDECVRKLNRYKKSTKTGKRAALNLTIHFNLSRLAVNEGRLKR